MKTAVIFPGQGAQATGMGKSLVDAYPDLSSIFEEAADTLGYDLAQVCFEGPDEELTKSDRAQPAIFAVSVAAFTVLQKERPGLAFDAAAGLSSGEWAALYAAGAVSLSDALRVLEARGRFMQEACVEQPGGMVSIMGLDLEALQVVCDETGLEIANLNSSVQTVLSGPRDAVEPAVKLAGEKGAKRALPLNVAGAFHSRLMKPAADRFEEFLAGISIQSPQFPVASNVTGEAHGDPEHIRSAMVRQITESVNWVGNVEWMSGNGVERMVECGPGRVLTGLIKRIDKAIVVHNIQDPADLEGIPEA